jgi:hypothetical protein
MAQRVGFPKDINVFDGLITSSSKPQKNQADNRRIFPVRPEVDKLIPTTKCLWSFVSFEGNRLSTILPIWDLSSRSTRLDRSTTGWRICGGYGQSAFIYNSPVLAVGVFVWIFSDLIVLHKESWDIEPWEVS